MSTPRRRKSYKPKGNSTPSVGLDVAATGTTITTTIPSPAPTPVSAPTPAPAPAPAELLNPSAVSPGLPSIAEEEEMEVCDESLHAGDGNEADDEGNPKKVDDMEDTEQGAMYIDVDQPDKDDHIARLHRRIEAESRQRREHEARTTNALERLADKLDLLLIEDDSKAKAVRKTPQLAGIKRRSAFAPPKKMFTTSKSPSETSLNENIRVFAMHLMNRRKSTDPMPQPASDEEVDLFAKGKHPGPTATRGMFYLDLRGPYTSPWNKRASECFSEAFVKVPSFNCTDVDLVRQKFNRHIRSLSDQFDRLEGTFEPRNQDENAADTRLRQLGFQRGVAVLSFDGLKDQEDILFNVLGLDSMSDDERDGVGIYGERRFRIIEQEWKHPDLTYWVRILDGLYISTRFNEAGKPTPGNWPRIRLPPAPNAPKSKKLPPSGLPRNFFNPEYLASLYPYQLARLQVKPPRKLEFPPELIEYRDVTSSSMRPLPPPNDPPPNDPPPKKASLAKPSRIHGGSPVAGPSKPSTAQGHPSMANRSKSSHATKFNALTRDQKVQFVEERLKRRRTDDEEETFDINVYDDDEMN
ncbi:hypothetical protein SCHPADRAFT_895681 [Schizopora paradoxa]|uniref:Uncharacterized protein n=1 Tax=Schizopora paradoxa TaxID=27342 RepID=A0A0H2R312_9AGAM|nr:hypothetical protein SCHPADRAFT_895681 [Schizopora paradoxa]